VETKASSIKHACERIKAWPEAEARIYKNADATHRGEIFYRAGAVRAT
jgi:hypothetical protein